jgi:F0F1-type ATP synthase alpha subunit
MDMADQVILLFIYVTRLVAGLPAADVASFKIRFIEWIHDEHPEIPEAIARDNDISGETERAVTRAVQEFYALEEV